MYNSEQQDGRGGIMIIAYRRERRPEGKGEGGGGDRGGVSACTYAYNGAVRGPIGGFNVFAHDGVTAAEAE